MEKAKKITVEVPEQLLQGAQEFTGKGISETIRMGLLVLLAQQAAEKIKTYRGKLKLSDWRKLKEDR